MQEIEYEVTEPDLLAFNEHLLRHADNLQRLLTRRQTIVPAICFILALVMWFYFHNSLAAIFTAIVAFCWGVGVPLYQRWARTRYFKNFYSEEDKAKVLGVTKLTVTPNALVESNANGESRLKWSDLLRVDMTRTHGFIFVSMDAALIIPRKKVLKGDFKEFVTTVAKHIDAAE